MRSAVKNTREAGYTLVEISVVLLIIGILVGSFLHLYVIYQEQKKIEKTELSQKRVKFALDDFKRRYGRYPCPSSYEAERDDPAYGYAGDCSDVTVAPGSCSNGYCIELSERTVPMDDGTDVTPRVRRGAVPFRTLGLTEDELYDAYGGRFSYVVTELLTDWRTFSVARGGISIVDNQMPTSQSVVDPAHSALYFIFSHGKDNIGAYNRQGNLMAACNGTMLDNENCNTSPTEQFATYRASLHSEVPIDTIDAGAGGGGGGPPPVAVDANRHYDDFVFYDGKGIRPLWKYAETGDPNNVHDVLRAAERVIIGPADPTQKLNVAGDILLTPGSGEAGNAEADGICGQDDDVDCFNPNLIGGDAMNECPVSQYANRIGNREIGCDYAPEIRCSEALGGRFIVGISDTGQIVCGDIHMPVNCPATTGELCGETRSVPESPHGTRIDITAGASRTATVYCNDGSWEVESEGGVCSCTPSTTVTTDACGPGYEGNATTTTTTVCPSGETTTVTDRAECVCVPGENSETIDCPWPLSGTRTRTQTFICNASGESENWWSPWDESACFCPPQAPQTQNVSCPSPLTGTATRTRTRNMASCSWNSWTYDYSACSCVERTENTTRACPSPLTGTYQEQRALACPSATWGPWGPVGEGSAGCSCNNRYEYRDASCPPGRVGERTERRTVDCHGNPVSGSTWQEDTNYCMEPPRYYWREKEQYPGTVNSPGTMVDSQCTAGDLPRTCYKLLFTGTYTQHRCACET